LIVALIAGLQPHASFAEEPPGTARPAITRADLAAAYLRLEQAFFARPLSPDEVARINKSFDQATQAFFLGNNADAIRTIDSLTESLVPEKHSPSEHALFALKVTVDPPALPVASPRPIVCRVTSIYDWPSRDTAPSNLQLRLVGPQGKVVAERPCAVTLRKGRNNVTQVSLEFTENQLEPGLYRIEIAPADGRSLVVGRVHLIDGAALDEQRLTNDRRLTQINASSTQISQAITTCRARNHLLSDHPSEDNSAQFLADLNTIATDVASEIRALEAEKNPYSNRQGDYWRVLEVGKREIPLRLYVPKLAAPEAPAPLLVVLHGMGGDENMFFSAYGAGIVKRIADEKGLIVASPLTYTFGSDVKTLHALIDALAMDYAIDRDRVYVVGHSMGAGVAAGLARGHADTVAAACCIAGGRFQPAQNSAPILVVSPELDGVVAPKRLQDSARIAISEGMPGELKIMPGYGHTLAVGAILPEAIDWLLRHRRAKSP
jgi:predicted esterase